MFDYFISNGDFVFTFDFVNYFNKLFYLWSFQSGNLNLDDFIRFYAKLPNLIVFSFSNSLIVSYFYLFLILFVPFVALFVFLKDFLELKNKIFLGTLSLFFILNPIFLGNLCKGGISIAIAMLPLLLLFIKKYFKSNKLKYFLYFAICLNVSLVHPFVFLINIFISFLYFLYLIILNKKLLFKNIFYGLIIILLFNASIILPIFVLGTIEKFNIVNDLIINTESISGLLSFANTGGVFNVFAMFKPVLTDFMFFDEGYRLIYFYSTTFLILIILGLYFLNKKILSKKDKITSLTFLLLFLLFSLFATGKFLGIDRILTYINNLPGGWSFRSPLKWQLYIPFFLFSFFAIQIKNINALKTKIILFFLCILVIFFSNYYIFNEIYNKLLIPKKIETLIFLKDKNFNYERMLIINDQCYSKINQELRQILISKNIQTKKISNNDFNISLIDSFDYILSCHEINSQKLFLENSISELPLFFYSNIEKNKFIYSVKELFLTTSYNLLEKENFVKDNFKKNFKYITETNQNISILTCLYGLFDEVNYKKINQEKLLISENININQNKVNNFYNSQTVQEIFYKKYNNEIFVYTKIAGDLFLNNQSINVFKAQEKILAKQIIDLNKQYYFKINNQIIKADNYTGLIGKIEQNNVLEIYSLDNNLIDNHSFENGTWAEKVGDCNNYDDNRILAMSLSNNVKSDGEQSLQLEATRHTACTNQRFKVEPGEYVLSFDYQSNNADKAGFYLSLNDENKTVFKNTLAIDNNEWQAYDQLITVPEGASLARLHIYAYESDKSENNIVRYDNFSFAKLNLEKAITVNKLKDDYKKIEIDLNQEENIFEYKEAGYDYKNQIINGSFENGTWTEKVGDCHNYDDSRILAMSLNNNVKSDGEQSLQLEAARHIACTSLGQPVKSGSTYLFSFDYQSDNAKQAGYYLGFNDSEKTKISEKIDIENSEWKTIEKNIKVPEGATKMSIYVYAYETDGKINNIVRYDNFKLIELPDLTDRFYLVSEPKEKLNEPKETNFDLINPTKKLIHIKGATTPFFLAMSESYHAQWELQMNNERIQGILNSWWPFAQRQKVNDEYHYKLANFLNAWYVDPQALCENNNSACKINEDGSYDIEMVAEFWPQRWFYLGLLISGTTLIGCVGYLGYDFIRERKKRKKEKVK